MPLPATATFDELCQEAPFARLVAILRELGSVVVAYSGGVDSTFLFKVAREVLGDRALGVLGVSESLDQNELRAAEHLARELRLPVEHIDTREYDNPAYRRNQPDRCYHCKRELFTKVRELARARGIPWVLDGSHAGDRGDYRPGLRARDEQGVRSPLMEAGLDKEAIRRYSRALGLPTWDKPAAPCLASRIPYGTEVTDEKLRQIEAVEAALSSLGFAVRRVRHHGDIARIEVPRHEIAALLEPATLERLLAAAKAAGFRYVAADLEGFRSGSLNPAGLVPDERLAPRAGV
jgi:uncharacterized protein